jgi:hypothetical protein
MNRGTRTVASDQRITPAAFWRDSLLTTPRLSLILSKLLREPAAWVRSPVIQAGIAFCLTGYVEYTPNYKTLNLF